MNALTHYSSAAMTAIKEHHGSKALQPLRFDWTPGLLIPLFDKEGIGELHKAVQHVLPLTRA